MRTLLKEYEPILYIYRPQTKFRDKVDLILPEASVILFTGVGGAAYRGGLPTGSALGRSAYGGELGRTPRPEVCLWRGVGIRKACGTHPTGMRICSSLFL